MRYKSFRIRNFKGIRDTTVSFGSSGSPSVFAFVGLNESGKTTLLEAIHSFNPDRATSQLVGGEEGTGVPYSQRVPRHLISTFTGSVSVTAVIEISESDKKKIATALQESHSLIVDVGNFPSEVALER